MKMTWEQFEERFQPIKNHITKREEFNGWLFETYDDDLAFVMDFANKNPEQVWTILDCDGATVIGSGYHLINRMGYIICKVRFKKDDDITVIDRDDEELYTLPIEVRDNKGEIVYTSSSGLSGILSEMEDDMVLEEGEVSDYEIGDWLTENGYTYEFQEDNKMLKS